MKKQHFVDKPIIKAQILYILELARLTFDSNQLQYTIISVKMTIDLFSRIFEMIITTETGLYVFFC